MIILKALPGKLRVSLFDLVNSGPGYYREQVHHFFSSFSFHVVAGVVYWRCFHSVAGDGASLTETLSLGTLCGLLIRFIGNW